MRRSVARLRKGVVFVFGALLLYLAYFQAWEGPRLARTSSNPRLQILAERVVPGGIYARGGERLAGSEGGKRFYPFGPVYAHVVGYGAARLGKSGLEGVWAAHLLGLRGGLWRSVSLRWGLGGRQGNDIYLTLDHKLQERAFELLSPYRGAAVVLEPRTGEVLALVSSPSFDPNPAAFTAAWPSLRRRGDHPLLNRALAGLYPPGSTLKVVTAALGFVAFPGLEGEEYVCRGFLTVGGRKLRDLRPHGTVTLGEALALSCNSYFARLGLRLGAARFLTGLEAFGWGEEVPFDLPAATPPLPRRLKEDANALAEAAIGQGELLASPFFMCLVAGCIANSGVMMKPYLVKSVRSPEGRVLWEAKPQVWRECVPPEVAARVREAMTAAVERGTARAAALPGVAVAGKTGSAENPGGAPHAWFIGFAPAADPRVAVSVLVENGGEGGKTAAPIARALLEEALAGG